MNWMSMAIGLLGGIALFLYGMEMMTSGLKAAAGERMKTILGKLSSNRISALLTGAFVTAVIQSSTVTTVLTVGFVSAGLLTMVQSVGIIFGANVGTTFTAHIVAFRITDAALPMIIVGFAMLFAGKGRQIEHFGKMVMGLGLLFYGMAIMSDAMAPLRTHEPFHQLMGTMENPFLGMALAAIFTILVNSSSATISLAVVMAAQGFITLEAGIPIVFGAKIGTCLTAVLAALGKSVDAKRTAAIHVSYNVLGALLWVAFIDQLAQIATAISPLYEELDGYDRLAAETPRQIANAATIWAVANAALFLPFAGVFVKLVTWLIPERAAQDDEVRPRFIDDSLLGVPSLAMDQVQQELGHVGERVERMVGDVRSAFVGRDAARFDALIRDREHLSDLCDLIVAYLQRIGRSALSADEAERHVRLLAALSDLEGLADSIALELVPLGRRFSREDIVISDTTGDLMNRAYGTVRGAVSAAVRSVVSQDGNAAQEVLDDRMAFWRQSEDILRLQAGKLAEDDPKRLLKHRLQIDLLDKLRRLYLLAEHVAVGELEVAQNTANLTDPRDNAV